MSIRLEDCVDMFGLMTSLAPSPSTGRYRAVAYSVTHACVLTALKLTCRQDIRGEIIPHVKS
jgi:hypothetical protein